MARVRLEIDDPANRLTLRAILLAEGHEIAQEGAQAVFVDKPQADAVFTRAEPCIVLTRPGDLPETLRAMRNGAFGYILAPLMPGEAGLALQRALEWSSAPPAQHAAQSAPLRVDEAETRAILAALRQCRNNRTDAARLLGIGRNTLWRKLKRIQERRQTDCG